MSPTGGLYHHDMKQVPVMSQIRTLIVLCFCCMHLGLGQVTMELAPSRVLKLGTLIRGSQTTRLHIDQVSMKGSNWAALVRPLHGKLEAPLWPALLVQGNQTQEGVARVPPGTSRIWSSLDGNVYVESMENRDSPAIFQLPRVPADGRIQEPQKIHAGAWIPRITAEGVSWRQSPSPRRADQRPGSAEIHPPEPLVADPDEGVVQKRWLFGGPRREMGEMGTDGKWGRGTGNGDAGREMGTREMGTGKWGRA